MPSAQSVLQNALIGLWEVSGDPGHQARSLELLRSISGTIARMPLGAANSTRGLLRLLRADAGMVGEALCGAQSLQRKGAENHDGPRTVAMDVVEVLAAEERVVVAPDEPAVLSLRLLIKPGHHINAAVPALDPHGTLAQSLVGLRVGVTNGTGVRVYSDYPPGEPFGPEGVEQALVHVGQVDLDVVVEREGEWSGRPLLTVTYQACTDRECLPATTVELDVAIDRR
jgi:hypothetical protein